MASDNVNISINLKTNVRRVSELKQDDLGKQFLDPHTGKWHKLSGVMFNESGWLLEVDYDISREPVDGDDIVIFGEYVTNRNALTEDEKSFVRVALNSSFDINNKTHRFIATELYRKLEL